MNISDNNNGSKNLFRLISNGIKTHQPDIIIFVCMVLLTITSYNLGKITAYNSMKTPLAVLNPSESDAQTAAISPTPKADLSVVASSKSKSRLYHFKWCPGTSQISPANLLIFPNETAALAAGYKLASNCKR